MNRLTIASLVFITFLLATAPAGAQTRTLQVGLAAGASLATLAGDIEGTDRRTGMTVDVRVGYGLTDVFQVETGIGLVQKGAEALVFPDREQPLEQSHHYSYLEVPLVLRASLPLEGPVRPSLLAGPSVAFEIACEVAADLLSSFSSPLDCARDDRTKTDWSLVFGGGLSWDLGSVSALLEARYQLGLTDLAPPDAGGRTENRAVLVVAGVSFPARL